MESIVVYSQLMVEVNNLFDLLYDWKIDGSWWDCFPCPCPSDCAYYKVQTRRVFKRPPQNIEDTFLPNFFVAELFSQFKCHIDKIPKDITPDVRYSLLSGLVAIMNEEYFADGNSWCPITRMEYNYMIQKYDKELVDLFLKYTPEAAVVDFFGYVFSTLCDHDWVQHGRYVDIGGGIHYALCALNMSFDSNACLCPRLTRFAYSQQERLINCKCKNYKYHTPNGRIIVTSDKGVEEENNEDDIEEIPMDYNTEQMTEDVLRAISGSNVCEYWKKEASDKLPAVMLNMVEERKFEDCKVYLLIEDLQPPARLVKRMKEIWRFYIPQSHLPTKDDFETVAFGGKKIQHPRPAKKVIGKIHKFKNIGACVGPGGDPPKITNRMNAVDKNKLSRNDFLILSDWVNNRKQFQHFFLREEQESIIDLAMIHDSIKLNDLHSNHQSFGNSFAIPMKHLPVSFRPVMGFDEIENIEKAYEWALEDHYIKNGHHPESWDESMSPIASYECMVDLLVSAMRLTGSASEAFGRIKQWLYVRETNTDIYKLRPKFEKLNSKGVIWFYINILRRGLSREVNRRLIIDRSEDLTPQELKLNWNELYKSKTSIEKYRYAFGLPKFKKYIYETRQHISMVEYEMHLARFPCQHDRDKLNAQKIAPYVWKWFIPHAQVTSDLDEVDFLSSVSQEDTSFEERKGIFKDFWDKMTSTYNTVASKMDITSKITKPIEETRDAIMEVLAKMDGFMTGLITNIYGKIKDFFGYVNAKIPTIASVIELIYAYVVWIHTDNIILKITAFFTVLHALDLYNVFTNALSDIKEMLNAYVGDRIEVTSDDDKSVYMKIFDCLTDVCPRKAGILCAIFVCIFAGTMAIKGKKFGDLGSRVMDTMKNLHFVGAGMLGIERVFKYVTSIVKVALEWIGDNVFGLGSIKKEEKEAQEKLAKRIYSWGTVLDYFTTMQGIKRIRSDEDFNFRARNLVKEGYEYLSSMPHDQLPIAVDIYLKSKQRKLSELQNLVYRTNIGGAFRKTPFHIQLFGQPGVGKSTLHKMLVSKIRTEFYPNIPENQLIYSPMESTSKGEDWDGYNETNKVLVVDEMFKILSPEVVTQWVNIISCAPMLLPTPNLNDKGIHLESEWVLSNTNVIYPVVSGIASNEAVWRRRHLLVEVICDKQVFDKNTSKYDDVLWCKKYVPIQYAKYLTRLNGDKAHDIIVRAEFEKEIGPIRSKYPHLIFNLCSPIAVDGLETAENGAKYLNPIELPNGIVEPTRNLSFEGLWKAIISRRAALCDEEERAINTGRMEDIMEKYDDELIDIIEKNAKNTSYRTLVERIKNHISVPEIEPEDEDNTSSDSDSSSDISLSQLDEFISEQIRSDVEGSDMPNWKQEILLGLMDKEKVQKEYMFMYHGNLLIFEPEKLTLRKEDGELLTWNDEFRGIVDAAYDIKIPASVNGKTMDVLEVTGLYSYRNIERRRNLNALTSNEFRNKFGLEVVKNIFPTCTMLHRDSNIVVPTTKNAKPLMCYFDASTVYTGLVLSGGNPIFNDKYGPLGDESLSEEIMDDSYVELSRTFPMKSSEKEQYPGIQNQKLSMYYLKKIKRIDNSYYYMMDHEDSGLIRYIQRRFKLHDWLPTTVLTYLRNFRETLETFAALTEDEKLFVLSKQGFCRKFIATFVAIKKIYNVSCRQGLQLVKSFFWEPIKFVWRTLSKFHTVLVRIGAATCAVVLLSTIGSLFSPPNVVETTSKAYVRQPRTIKHQIITTATDNVVTDVISKNLFLINFGSGISNALGLRDHYFVCNAHSLPRGYDETEFITLKYKRTLQSEDWWSAYVPRQNIYVLPDRDLAIIYCFDFAPFKDIVKHFRTREDNAKHPIMTVSLEYVKENRLNIHDFAVHSVNECVQDITPDGQRYVVNDTLLYIGNPVTGSSGGVVYTHNNYCQRNIVGIQCAKFAGKGIAAVLSSQEIEDALQHLPKSVIHNGPYVCSDGFSVTSDLITEHINIVGVVPKDKQVGTIFKTEFEKTPIARLVPESNRIPAILSKQDFRCNDQHPLQHSINKCGRDVVQPLEVPLLKHIVDELVTDRVNRLNVSTIKKCSFDEVIRGITVDGCTSLNIKTSPGIPYVFFRTLPGKKTYVNYDEDGNITYVSDRLKTDFENQDRLVRSGVLPPSSMYEFPKDELRPIKKALGPPIKTRSISVCPLVLLLLYRKYNLAYDAAMQSQADGSQEFCVGINPEGRAWTTMFECMKVKNSTGIDLDVGNWDGHFPMDLKRSIVHVRNAVYKELSKDWTPGDDIARLTLAEFPIFGHTQFEDLVLQKNRGQSSGWGGTASENTEGHEILSDYILCKLIRLRTGVAPKKKFIQKNVCKRIYGDDIFYVLSPQIKELLTYDDIASFYEQLGWPITSAASKTEKLIEVPLHEISFLKRTFIKYKYGLMLSALDKSVIYDMLYWQRKSADPNQLYINLDLALRYIFPYGEKEFEDLKRLINTSLVKVGLKQISTTYYSVSCFYEDQLFN